MNRSELQSKSCKEKESGLIKGKCCENDQFGYTSLGAAKCLNILRLHWRHEMLFGGYSPSVPGNLSGHRTGRFSGDFQFTSSLQTVQHSLVSLSLGLCSLRSFQLWLSFVQQLIG
jgi:hypothetical protein